MSNNSIINKLLRDNIRTLKPYSSARDEYTGSGGILLDANENPLGSAVEGKYNRYPDPRQRKLKAVLAKSQNVAAANIFIGNGSDEAIDLLFRAFCNPGKDKAIILPPTYGMYKVCAGINDVEIIEVCLTNDFQIDVQAILEKATDETKLLFICSPNNPTGNTMKHEDLVSLISAFRGIVVIDEAYIDFSGKPSFVPFIKAYENVVVLQTMSKAWGMAGLRLGMAYASRPVIEVLNRIKPPYNVNMVTQALGLKALETPERKQAMVDSILNEKVNLKSTLNSFSFIRKIHPSDTNYLLVKVDDANGLYDFLVTQNIIVRNRANVTLCEGCLRITVGTEDENKALLDALERYQDQTPNKPEIKNS